MATRNPYRGGSQMKDFIDSLDEKLKRNKGGFTAMGQDVGNAYRLPGKAMEQSLPTSVSKPFTPPDVPVAPQVTPEPIGEVLGDSQSEDRNTFSDGRTDNRSETQVIYDMEVTRQQAEQRGVGTTYDGGIILEDGQTVVYPDDGTVRQGDPYAEAVGTNMDGSIMYRNRDGSISDRRTASDPQNDQEFMMAVFGRQLPITQEFGVINPMEPNPTNSNTGSDFGARFQPISNPYVGARVVDVISWDGERDPYKSNSKGYGNSIMLQLADGRTVRFSHLDSLGQFKVGDTLQGGEQLGISGNTGNTTGPHTDVEMTDTQGNIVDRSTFYKEGSSDKGGSNKQNNNKKDRNVFTKDTRDQTTREEQNFTPVPDGQVLGTQNVPTARQIMGNDIATTARNMGVKKDFGVSELVSGDVQGARNELGNTVAQYGKDRNLRDRGVSELLSGKIGVKDFLSGLGKPLQEKAGIEAPQQQSFAKTNEDLSQKVSQGGIGETVQRGLENTQIGNKNSLLPEENDTGLGFIKPAYAMTFGQSVGNGGQVLGANTSNNANSNTNQTLRDQSNETPINQNVFRDMNVVREASKKTYKPKRNVFRAPTNNYKKEQEKKKKKEQEKKKVTKTRSTSGFQSGFKGGKVSGGGGGGGGGSW
jgi:hypothetical protein